MVQIVGQLDDRATVAARCQEIQISLGSLEVPEFESIPELGMAVRLALHLRGLPLVDYETLKLVSVHFLGIPRLAVERIVILLADVGFIRLQKQGSTVKAVLPIVPYYEEVYDRLGEYALTETSFNEAEQLALTIVDRLAESPEKTDKLRNDLGAESKLFDRNIEIGRRGSYLVVRRCRGREVVINPVYFSENAELFADHVAATGADVVKGVLGLVQEFQGWPLSLIEIRGKIGNMDVTPEQVALLKRLAQDGAVKPPYLETSYSGKNHFIFTPTPARVSLSPLKREVYERALATVAAVRLGQLMPEKYAIHSPGAVLYRLKTDLRLSKGTTEFREQYRNLVHLRVGRLVDVGGGYSEFHIIDTPENREALNIAYSLVTEGTVSGLEVDEEARIALQRDQRYVESLIASSELRKRETIALSEEEQDELERLLLAGVDL
jgi:hypothetical protein